MKQKHLLAVILSVLPLATPALLPAADATRQQGVAQRGAQVMPFDLNQTMHYFEPLEDGGLQRVTAKDAASKEQVALIQSHLKEEAERFRRGDFSDPAAIHGMDMPGLAELSEGAARIEVAYAERADGAEIRYRTEDAALVTAIHRWFRAQLSDHGHHASGHSHHGDHSR